MYVIETELGRFEGDTEKQAKAALRKRQKEQEKIDAEECRLRKIAQDRAESMAYRFYERHHQGRMPKGWRVLPVSESGYSCRRILEDGYRVGYEIDGGDSRARVFPYDAITYYVENGAGFCTAIAIANQDVELFAVGVHEGRACWVPMPGISMTEFTCPQESQ